MFLICCHHNVQKYLSCDFCFLFCFFVHLCIYLSSVGQHALYEPCTFVYLLLSSAWQHVSKADVQKCLLHQREHSESWQALSRQLPVVMRVPRFSAWALNMCGMQFSILGFGDIIVPGDIQNIGIWFLYNNISKTIWMLFPSSLLGLLVAYCSRFDVRINSRNKVYFISCCIGTSLLTCNL